MIPSLKPRSLPMTIGTQDLDKTLKMANLSTVTSYDPSRSLPMKILQNHGHFL